MAARALKPPAWARALDALTIALVLLAAVAAVGGGIRIRASVIRLSLTSPWRLLLAALIVAVVRHVAAPAVPIYRALPAPDDDVDVRAAFPTARFAVMLVGVFAALTAVMTYPLVFRLRDGLHDPGDPLLNLWALQWVAHALVTAPMQMFDANIFSPEKHALAYSETLIAPGLVVAPLSWAGVGGVLIHNLVFLAGMIASGVGTALLVRELTGAVGPSVLAGIVFAFFPFRFDHPAQLQLQQAQWIPFSVWALHRVLWHGRLRDGIWLGVCVAAQLLSCMYYGMFLALYLPVIAVCLFAWRLRRWRLWLPALAVGAVTALLLFAPAATAYIRAREVVGERSRQENIGFSATPSNYLAAPDSNRLYGRTAVRFGGLERNLFPGIATVVLAAIALWPPLSAVRAAYAIGLLFAVDLTLGFNGATYSVLYDAFPPIRALRIPALAIVLVGFSVAVLAGFGAARIRRRAAIPFLAVAILAEGFAAPIPLVTLPLRPPQIYNDLARASNTADAIVELPIIYSLDPLYQDQIYMYYSTFHWRPLLNGYSGFFPESYLELAAVMRTFPDDRSLDLLQARGARFVVVHGERMPAEEYQRITGAVTRCECGVSEVARRPWNGAEITLYRLENRRSRQ